MRQVSEFWQRIAGNSERKQPRRRRPPPKRSIAPGRRHRLWDGLVWASTSWPATAAGVLFILASMTYAAALGGKLDHAREAFIRIANGAADGVGLSALNVSVSGLKHAAREDVLAIVGVEEGGSIVEFDARGARERLVAEDWIASASILRQFPNTLHIEIVEREPFALWQYKGEFSVVDRAGVALSHFPVRDHLELPIVVGRGAGEAAWDLVNQLEAWSDLKSKVRAAARVAERRWTLYLSNGINVLLPEEGVDRALRELDRLHREQDLLNRAIESVDLRVSRYTVITLSEEGAKARKVKLAEVSKR